MYSSQLSNLLFLEAGVHTSTLSKLSFGGTGVQPTRVSDCGSMRRLRSPLPPGNTHSLTQVRHERATNAEPTDRDSHGRAINSMTPIDRDWPRKLPSVDEADALSDVCSGRFGVLNRRVLGLWFLV